MTFSHGDEFVKDIFDVNFENARSQEDNTPLARNLLSKIGLKYQDFKNDDEHERIIVQQFGYGFNADFSPCLLLAYYEENIVVKTIRATHSILKKIPLF